MGYDHFSVYGFGVDYPEGWRVELHPGSRRKRGDVVFRSPKGGGISISWNEIEQAEKTYASLDELVDGTLEKIKRSRGVKSVEVMERKELEVNGHRAVFTHIKVKSVRRSFLKKRVLLEEYWSCHLFCEPTARCFALYGSSSSDERSTEREDIFQHTQKSFTCHSE